MKFPVKSLLAGNFHICFARVTSWSPASKSAAFGAAPVVACSVMHCLRLNSRHGDRLWSSETLNGRDAESARARCDGDAANERLMTADRRAIRAVADDGYEPFRKGQREIRKN
jgi:hypothetical protein